MAVLRIATVHSETHEGLTYGIKFDTSSATVTCECPSFVYCKRDLSTCKHLKMLQMALSVLE